MFFFFIVRHPINRIFHFRLFFLSCLKIISESIEQGAIIAKFNSPVTIFSNDFNWSHVIMPSLKKTWTFSYQTFLRTCVPRFPGFFRRYGFSFNITYFDVLLRKHSYHVYLLHKHNSHYLLYIENTYLKSCCEFVFRNLCSWARYWIVFFFEISK